MRKRLALKTLAVSPLLVLLVGCQSTPQTYSNVELASEERQAAIAGDYWTRNSVPDMREHGYKRVAITDFSVEFVTERKEAPLATRTTRYDQPLYGRIANMFYDELVKTLNARGLEVVAPATIRATPAYRRFVTPLSLEGPADNTASDLGRVAKVIVRPAKDYRIIDDAYDAEIESVEASLLNEVKADVSLRVRLRVGVYNGHATLERGSTIWVLSDRVLGNLTADRSLLSDAVVTFSKPGASTDVYSVDTDRYVDAMKQIYPAFINMAFLSRPH